MEQPLGRQAEQCLAAGQDPNTQRLCLWTQSYRGFNPHQGGGGAGGLGGRGGGGFGLVAMWFPPVAWGSPPAAGVNWRSGGRWGLTGGASTCRLPRLGISRYVPTQFR